MSINSETQLVNNALIRLGANTITDIDTDGSHESNTMQQLYAPTRDALLRQHFWNFAMTRISLAENAITPAFEWAAQYELPADFIRIKSIFNSDGPFTIEGTAILTDTTTELQVVYVKKVTDVTAFDPLFVQTLTLMLAILAAPRIQSDVKVEVLMRELKELIMEAKIVDAQDGSADNMIISTFQDSRNGLGIDRFSVSNIL